MSSGFVPDVYEDLARSGLKPEDIDARPLDGPERSMTNVPVAIEGYVIPYYNIDGEILPFYRARVFGMQPKYKQPKDSPNHIYFPINFKELATSPNRPFNYVIITEGEKKCATGAAAGIPTVAVSGVDSWKTKTVILPGDTEFLRIVNTKGQESLKASLPSTGSLREASSEATGFSDLVDFLVEHKLGVFIIYDSDKGGTKFEVQRAASTLAHELRYRGIPFNKIRQVVLPPTEAHPGPKIGLDDFILQNGQEALYGLLQQTLDKRVAFPRHPNVREFVSKKLQSSRLSRKEIQALGLAVLSDLDSRGRRLRSKSEDQLYYFDSMSRKLIKAALVTTAREVINDTEFGRFLYNEFSLSLADHKLLTWFATQFSAEEPVEEVVPSRVIARHSYNDDSVIYQINDGQFVEVTKDGIEIHDNGSKHVMFESGQVEPLDAATLLEEIERQRAIAHSVAHPDADADAGVLKAYWHEVLQSVRLKEDDPYLAEMVTLLFYFSPWLHRWRGTQTPVELIIGESGSGKSSLYELRLNILMGYPHLRNAPQDLRDWHASIASSGGLHVTDNVQLVDKNLRQRLSDEICRIVTEPKPHIEMRRLYSNADLLRVPVNTVFAITAIQQPFINADILQRAVTIELEKSSDGSGTTYDSLWGQHQLERYGGRHAWLAHHLLVLERFFKQVDKEWDPNYRAQHRLINLEQGLIMMAKALGMDHKWIPGYLSGKAEKNISEADWALEGLAEFAKSVIAAKAHHQKYSCRDIATWASEQEAFMQCVQITDSRRLGRYMQTHRNMVATIAGLVEDGKVNNAIVYKAIKK